MEWRHSLTVQPSRMAKTTNTMLLRVPLLTGTGRVTIYEHGAVHPPQAISAFSFRRATYNASFPV